MSGGSSSSSVDVDGTMTGAAPIRRVEAAGRRAGAVERDERADGAPEAECGGMSDSDPRAEADFEVGDSQLRR